MADSLAGIPGMTDSFRSFVASVRFYLRDIPELNRLVAGEESGDRQIAWAVLDALSDFNGTPPFIGSMSLEHLLQRDLQYLLMRMTACSLIESVGLLQTRNHVNYSTGGINIGVNDKTPLLMGWLQYFKAFTDQRKQAVKVAMNIEQLWGSSGIFSEYWVVNGTYARF